MSESDNPQQFNRPDRSLRHRIAAVLYEDGQRPMPTAMRLADAVIAELNLHAEKGRLRVTRYVTNWKIDA